jgi:hypothetical protein
MWRGSDINNKKPALAAGHLITDQNVKEVWVSRNCQSRMMFFSLKTCINFTISAAFPGYNCFETITTLRPSCQDIMKLLDQYKGLNIVTVGDGKSVAFGEDLWGGHVPKRQDPELFSFASNKLISLQSHRVSQMEDLASLFQLSLSIEAFEQFQELQQIIWNLQVNDNRGPSRHTQQQNPTEE